MNHYAKYARTVQFLSGFIICAEVLLTIAYWFYPPLYQAIYSYTGCYLQKSFDMYSHEGKYLKQSYDFSNFTAGQKFVAFAVDLIGVALFIYGLFLVIRLMQYIAENKYFSSSTIAILQKLTRTALFYAIYNPVANTIMSVVSTINNKPGERVISVSIGTPEIINIMLFCILFLLVTMFQKGYELEHEHELTV